MEKRPGKNRMKNLRLATRRKSRQIELHAWSLNAVLLFAIPLARIAWAGAEEQENCSPAQSAEKETGAGASAAAVSKITTPLQSQAKVALPADGTPSVTAGEKKTDVPARKNAAGPEFWPSWFKMGVQYRGRMEHPKGRSYAADTGDGYYLNRIRVDAILKVNRFLEFTATTQDSRSFGYDLKARPPGFMDAWDLRQAFMNIHGKWEDNTLAFRVGRQVLDVGSKRLVATSSWANSPPTYDAAKLSYGNPEMTAEAFAASRVSTIHANELNEVRKGENIYGSYFSFGKLVPKAEIEPYVFWRTQPLVTDEKGKKGDSDLVTFGMRFLGKLPRAMDYTAELAVQRGSFANDKNEAWAGSWGLSHLLSKSSLKPKVLFEYNYATGDAAKADGTRGTFDQLYASNHSHYGIADAVGWKNTSNYKVGLDIQAHKRLRIQFDINNFYLATTQDALYGDNGTAIVTNIKATSRHVGWEPDIQVNFKVSNSINIGAGYGALIPGRFLKQSTAGNVYHYPYILWEFQY